MKSNELGQLLDDAEWIKLRVSAFDWSELGVDLTVDERYELFATAQSLVLKLEKIRKIYNV